MNPLKVAAAQRPAHDQLDELMLSEGPKGTKAMLLYEDLARERMREAERDAREQRLVRQLTTVRRWERLSAWAARRALRAASPF